MSRAVISASGVSHSFDTGPTPVTVLRDIDLEVNAGELLMLVGPSGSGKTTLLHILGRLLSPTSGVVTLYGADTQSLAEEELAALRLKYFGFVFQSYNLFPVLTATENVMVMLDLLGTPRQIARDRARELLKSVGLGQRLDSYPSQLSSGQRQRVAIARALAGDPKILMADEPTAALDSESGLRAMELLQLLAHQQERAVVIVTHDPRILHFADRVIHLEDGQIAERSGRAQGSSSHAMGVL
ncbi:MAG: ABC transporter ATP-binding protein [Methylocystis sp.]|uniref:ABC transporter ATP-binding protein n=1 Tax=Methylocystis sp. TaxID=1911079 RepID=UPI003D0AFC91